jgi:hypothetical protein
MDLRPTVTRGVGVFVRFRAPSVITTTITERSHLCTVPKGSGAPCEYTKLPGTTFTTSVSNANADTYTFVITMLTVVPSYSYNGFTYNRSNSYCNTGHVGCNAGSDGSVTLTELADGRLSLQ